jgi:hypothetical protein
MEHDHDDNSAQSEIAEINREYEENLSRSDEEGWFYPDDDGQDDECSSED